MRGSVPGVVVQVALGVILAAAGWRPPSSTVQPVAEVGLVVLLFSIGVDTDPRELLRCGKEVVFVALLGVAFSLVTGIAAALALGWPPPSAVFAGGVLSATSVAISARVLERSGWFRRDEGRVVLGAAVADDIAGLLLLGLVASSYAPREETGIVAVLWPVVWASAFVVAAVVLGMLASERLGARMTSRLSCEGIAVMGCVAGAIGAHAVGLEPFLGSFLTGAAVPVSPHAPNFLRRIGSVLAPVYFVLLGARVNVGTLGDAGVLVSAFVFVVVATAAKTLSGVGARPSWDRIAVGMAMVPRGEVGLVFAGAGLAAGVLVPKHYAALVTTVLATSLLGPTMLHFRIATKAITK
jgi:Kef-type K+ transport system membrane component KefB